MMVLQEKSKNRNREAKHTPPGELIENDVFAINYQFSWKLSIKWQKTYQEK
jgi:hypothetical protein